MLKFFPSPTDDYKKQRPSDLNLASPNNLPISPASSHRIPSPFSSTDKRTALSYLFLGIQQLSEAIHALNNTKFKDEKGQAHQGIIHNDIKPNNIFLKTNGNFILGDFSSAYFKDEAATQISTFQFSAPELFTAEGFCMKSLDNINADVWSLGVFGIY